MTKVPHEGKVVKELSDPHKINQSCGSDKVPDEKLFRLIRDYGDECWSHKRNKEILLAEQELLDYIKSLHLKIKNDWFARGLKAGKISKNTSGCCCVIEDDGETISSLCGAHKALHDKKVEDFKQLAETYRRILNAKGSKAEEV